MSPTVYKYSKVKVKMHSKTGDGRKEHDPAHLHILYKDNEVTFEIGVIKRLNDEDFTIKQGKLCNNMKELAQYLLDTYQSKLMEMWKTQHFYEILD